MFPSRVTYERGLCQTEKNVSNALKATPRHALALDLLSKNAFEIGSQLYKTTQGEMRLHFHVTVIYASFLSYI